MTYLAFDVANGYRTQIFDLNSQSLNRAQTQSFDIILNFGTTEHVMNQLNALKVIHDAVKVGGHIVHSVPCLGDIDHGYVAYTPRLFFDVASYDNYEIIDFRYEGPVEDKPIMDIVRDYGAYFPAANRYVNEAQVALKATDVAIYLIQKRTITKAFLTPMDTSPVRGVRSQTDH